MPTVVSEGVTLAVDVMGDGEPVTLVAHGLTGNRKDLAILAPFVPGTKVLFDFRGHGDSGRPPAGRYSMDHFAADVDNVASAFDASRLVGVSLGGGATLRLLRSRPDRFERLVFILPARLEEADQATAKLLRLADLLEARSLEEVAAIVVAEEDAGGAFDGLPGTRDRRREAILSMNRDGMPHAIRESIADPPIPDPEPIRKVTAPALVVGQEGDPAHRAEVARDLARILPNADLILFEDPAALLAAVAELTARVGAFLAG